MLHVCDGSSAIDCLQLADIKGDFLSWKDVYHDGPFPKDQTPDELAHTRATFIASLGWAPVEEALEDLKERDQTLMNHSGPIVLWFNGELFDQLQLVDILDRLTDKEEVHLVHVEGYLPFCDQGQIQDFFEGRKPVTAAQTAVARRLWQAFRDPNPPFHLLQEDFQQLPFMNAAVKRLAQMFPDGHGLSRTQRQILTILEKGPKSPGDLFRANWDLEEMPFMGDSSFWQRLLALMNGPHPLVQEKALAAFHQPGEVNKEEFDAQSLSLTDLGRAVLRGEQDHIALNGIDIWIGGVHLQDPQCPRFKGFQAP